MSFLNNIVTEFDIALKDAYQIKNLEQAEHIRQSLQKKILKN